MEDPTVGCDPLTCRWDLALLDPEEPPLPCVGLNMDQLITDITTFPDPIEPCLWWEILYGDYQELQPSASPSFGTTETRIFTY